jgi:hypothetical protein
MNAIKRALYQGPAAMLRGRARLAGGDSKPTEAPAIYSGIAASIIEN